MLKYISIIGIIENSKTNQNGDTPDQEKLVASINILIKPLASLISLKQSGMLLVSNKEFKEVEKNKGCLTEVKKVRYNFIESSVFCYVV